MRRLAGALMALAAAGCAATLRPAPTQSAVAPGSVPLLAAAIAADAKRSEHENNAKIRAALATHALSDAQACLAREPQAAACLYGHAVALGLEARAHPTRAAGLLTTMLESLSSAEAADPDYDQAGPERVRALVLIRAPGWPLGPGDAEAGLAAARRAVALRPAYPPNLLALAEALAKSGELNAARQTYQQVRVAALALGPSPDRDGWLNEADSALRGH
jgi:hypothetical protein